MKNNFRHFILPPLFIFAVALGLLEAFARSRILPSYLFPSPSEVARVFVSDTDILFQAFLSTGSSAIVGLFMSFILGTLSGILFSFSSFLRRAVYPYALFFQTVPIVTISPLLVIWLGFGKMTVIASSFIVSLFPMIASTLQGLKNTDPELLELFHLYQPSSFQFYSKLKLPAALPEILSGLRISAGLSMIGTVVGEFITGAGLGGLIDTGRAQMRLDLVFASVLLCSISGLFMIVLLQYASFFILRKWHATARSID